MAKNGMGRIKRGARKVSKPKPLRCAKKNYFLVFGNAQHQPYQVPPQGRFGDHSSLRHTVRSARRHAIERKKLVRIYASCPGDSRKVLMGTCTSTGCDMRRVSRKGVR